MIIRKTATLSKQNVEVRIDRWYFDLKIIGTSQEKHMLWSAWFLVLRLSTDNFIKNGF